MFAKFALFFTTLAVFSLQSNAHAIINPAIGVTGTPSRADVQRPSAAKGCGSVDVASVLATSTAVPVSGDAVNVNVQNFNGGVDGSREIASALVDTTATGASFPVTATITTNGIKSPTDETSQPISVSLPAGTTCTGGSDGKSCLVSFTTDGGFGNCVLVTQGAAGAAAGGAAANGTAAAGAAAGGAAGGAAAGGAAAAGAGAAKPKALTVNNAAQQPAAGAAAGKKAAGKKTADKKTHKHQKAGTRAARALLAELREREVQRFA